MIDTQVDIFNRLCYYTPVMKLSTNPYKGARDFYPEDQRIHDYIFSHWKNTVESYGYEKYDAPILELTDIYRAKSGQEIVDQQTYNFTDRGGRQVSIRPEMTPTVSRMVAARRQEIALPARWYSIPNLWRYERPQNGRLREHWQMNVDIFGVDTIDAEIELIMIANDLMKSFGAKQEMYTIKLNSRKLTALIMSDYLNLNAEQSHLMIKLLDRKDKVPKDTFEFEADKIFNSTQQSSNSMQKLDSLLSARSMADLPEELLNNRYVQQIRILFTHLRENGINNVRFDVALMRGFDYYTDIVFEVFDNHPDNNRSMFGGGRYDGLVGLFGVQPLPTVGFGIGDVTMQNFLEKHGLMPEIKSSVDVYLIPIGDTVRQVHGIAKIMRQEGVNVAVDITDRKTDKQIKSASKMGIKYVMFVGETELNNEHFTLKDLDSGEESGVSLERAISIVSDHRLRDEDDL